jgi:hypothetical protein
MQIEQAFAKLALTDNKVLGVILAKWDRESVAAMRGIKVRQAFRPAFINGVHTVQNLRLMTHGPAVRTAKQAARIADDLNAGRITWEN